MSQLYRTFQNKSDDLSALWRYISAKRLSASLSYSTGIISILFNDDNEIPEEAQGTKTGKGQVKHNFCFFLEIYAISFSFHNCKHFFFPFHDVLEEIKIFGESEGHYK